MGCGGSKDDKPKPDQKKDPNKEDPSKKDESKKKDESNKKEEPNKKEDKPASPKTAAAAAAEKPQESPKEAASASRAVAAEPTEAAAAASATPEPTATASEPVTETPAAPEIAETVPGTPDHHHPTAAEQTQSVPPVPIQDIHERRDTAIPVQPAEKMQPYQVNSSAANKQAGKDPLMIAETPEGTAASGPARSPRRASSATPRRLQRSSQGEAGHKAVGRDDAPLRGPGPSSDFPTEVMYPCFDEGQLYRVANEKRHMWGFYNDSTDYIMHVEATFGHESAVRALGRTQQVVHDESTGHCTLTLDIEPLKTEPFMRGEFNGFAIAYDAEPLPYEERQRYAAMLNGESAQ